MKNKIAKLICLVTLTATALLSTATSMAEEAYLGVGGYITSVPRDMIIGTTAKSSYITTACSTNKGFKIKKIENGSPADNAGLRYGDILIEAEGVMLNSYSNLSRMRRKLAQSDSIQLFFVRNGDLRPTWIGGSATITTTVQ